MGNLITSGVGPPDFLLPIDATNRVLGPALVMVMRLPKGTLDPTAAFALYQGTSNGTHIAFLGNQIDAHTVEVVQRLW